LIPPLGWPGLLVRVIAQQRAEMPVTLGDKAGLVRILINTVVLSAPWCR